ncbi:polysaccharide biosynthesis tyrosine autokinase [Kocuria sp.]|uniref:polysaccharide biosynthesis tyrosine autokinase n=2 Tax=Kocuria sp. TaxID=1871328 RepID=UPI0026E0A2C2|nr:polysaccharide biosynthesis tyrosine autokinase [Kocuria sp.]MDO5367531.1 Wzz/FepE/Etk N-terminal domain-containing protein [Kocuria sp.]
MTLRDYFDVLRKRWLVVAGLMLVGLLVGGVIALVIPPKYQATAQLYVAIPTSDSAAELNQAATYLSRELKSYATLATTPFVLEPVADRPDVNESVAALEGMLSVTNPTATSLIDVAATAETPEKAQTVANAVADELTRGVSTLSPSVEGRDSTVRATTISRAELPASSSGLPAWSYPLIGLASGAVLGAILAFLVEGLDRRPRTVQDLRQVRGAILAGAIPRLKQLSTRGLAQSSSHGSRGETTGVADQPRVPQQLVSLRSVLQRHHPEVLPHVPGSAVLLVTGSRHRDGATTVASELARSYADLGSRVVLVDAHLQNRGLSELLGEDMQVGVADIAGGSAKAEETAVKLGPNLMFIPAGTETVRPSDVVCSERMNVLIGELRDEFDVVVIDCSPLTETADSVVLSRASDVVLLVTVPGGTPMGRLQQAVDGYGDTQVALVANRSGHHRGANAGLS